MPATKKRMERPSHRHARALRQFKSEIFRSIAHPTRIHIIEELGGGEMPVGALQSAVGVEQANLSQHLSLLRSKRIVIARKFGNQVFYSLRDPLITEVLANMRKYFQAHLKESLDMLKTMESEA